MSFSLPETNASMTVPCIIYYYFITLISVVFIGFSDKIKGRTFWQIANVAEAQGLAPLFHYCQNRANITCLEVLLLHIIFLVLIISNGLFYHSYLDRSISIKRDVWSWREHADSNIFLRWRLTFYGKVKFASPCICMSPKENFTTKKGIFLDKNSYIFHFSAQNIVCGTR